MTWTEGHVRGFIQAVLRRAFSKWPPKYLTLKEAYVAKKINKATGRMAMHYRCNICEGHFLAKDIQIDHIIPVVDVKKGFVDWNEYIVRLFCSASNLQAVCVKCHKAKTAKENKLRGKRK